MTAVICRVTIAVTFEMRQVPGESRRAVLTMDASHTNHKGTIKIVGETITTTPVAVDRAWSIFDDVCREDATICSPQLTVESALFVEARCGTIPHVEGRCALSWTNNP